MWNTQWLSNPPVPPKLQRLNPVLATGWLTFSFLFLHAFSPPVDGGHLRLEGEVVVPDVLQLLLKERDPLQTVHLLQVSWGGQWKAHFQLHPPSSPNYCAPFDQKRFGSQWSASKTNCCADRLALTHLEAPLVHARRPCMVVPVLAVVGVALLVVLMAWRRRPSVTLGRRRHFGVRRADLGDGRLGGALHHRLVFAVTAVGWMTHTHKKKNKAQMNNPQIPPINLPYVWRIRV